MFCNSHYTLLRGSFSYKVTDLTVEYGRQFTEACHDVGIWQKPFVKLFWDMGFLVPFSGFAQAKVKTKIILFYYIDTSVLLENIPLVKFIKTTLGTRVVYFP